MPTHNELHLEIYVITRRLYEEILLDIHGFRTAVSAMTSEKVIYRIAVTGQLSHPRSPSDVLTGIIFPKHGNSPVITRGSNLMIYGWETSERYLALTRRTRSYVAWPCVRIYKTRKS